MTKAFFEGLIHGGAYIRGGYTECLLAPRILLRLRCHPLDRWNHPFQTLYWADIRVSLYSGGKTRY